MRRASRLPEVSGNSRERDAMHDAWRTNAAFIPPGMFDDDVSRRTETPETGGGKALHGRIHEQGFRGGPRAQKPRGCSLQGAERVQTQKTRARGCRGGSRVHWGSVHGQGPWGSREQRFPGTGDPGTGVALRTSAGGSRGARLSEIYLSRATLESPKSQSIKHTLHLAMQGVFLIFQRQ